MRFWRLFAAGGILLSLGDSGASAQSKPPAPGSPVGVGPVNGVVGVQGAQPKLENPPTIKFNRAKLAGAAKLAAARAGLHLTVLLTEQNFDAPVELSIKTPVANNGTFTMSATLVNQYVPTDPDGPYLDILAFGATGSSFHPNVGISFVVYPDRGALIDCTGGGGGALESQLVVQGAASIVNQFKEFPGGHLTAFVTKAPTQRTGSLLIRNMPGGFTFALGTCEITPIKY